MIQSLTLTYISKRKKLPYYIFKFVNAYARFIVFTILFFSGFIQIFFTDYQWYFIASVFLFTILYNIRNYYSLEIKKGRIKLTNEGIIVDDENGIKQFQFKDIKQLSIMYEYNTFIEQEKINDSIRLRVYNNFIFIDTEKEKFIYPFLIDKKSLFRAINGVLQDYRKNQQVNVKRLDTGDELVREWIK